MASSNDKNRQLSKCLSKILRHNAEKYHLKIDSNGYCVLDDVISVTSNILRQTITKECISDIVKNCQKTRFKLESIDGVMMIRANQGHTMKNVQEIQMTEIQYFKDGKAGKVIHGTNKRAWGLIKDSGLNKMQRNHIHMARGDFGDAKSGARWNSKIIITIDANKAIADGIKFYESDNGVILSTGDINGTIATAYFFDVFDVTSQCKIFPSDV